MSVHVHVCFGGPGVLTGFPVSGLELNGKLEAAQTVVQRSPAKNPRQLCPDRLIQEGPSR